ncbi:hypothetical protein AYL99_10231 [Fonsecaea erecta]|uniref:Xylanolytic transcriptional activator regulatory domain-containing protein n=1 Tax=Fonsecaea erecta TaxID=1367422 RepID=A0A178Z657_9EURO|nr:hypothetical protein AYL99_10231 [Fonsecaea erecta]OAP55258.1 hypothetical protein AYL99_10231 [Fonsecaea erecta]
MAFPTNIPAAEGRHKYPPEQVADSIQPSKSGQRDREAVPLSPAGTDTSRTTADEYIDGPGLLVGRERSASRSIDLGVANVAIDVAVRPDQFSMNQQIMPLRDTQYQTSEFEHASRTFRLSRSPSEPQAQGEVYQFDSTLTDLQPHDLLMEQPLTPARQLDFRLQDFDWDSFAPWGIDWLGLDQGSSIQAALPQLDPSWQSGNSPARPRQQETQQLPVVEGQSTIPMSSVHGLSPPVPVDQRSNVSSYLERRPIQNPPTSTPNLLESVSAVLSKMRLPSDISIPQFSAAVRHLEKLVNIYFAEFHPNLPVMHKPTWDISTCPTYLIAALACLGSTSYHKKRGLDEESSLLAEICSRHLNKAYRLGPDSYQNIDFVTASMLHQVYGLGVGVPSVHESADNFRGILVLSLRRTGVYRSRNGTDPWNLRVPELAELDLEDSSRLEAAWLQWRTTEMAKRLAWCLFEYDNSLSCLTTKRGVVSLQELPDRLPCNECLWEAHSTRAWASMALLTENSLHGSPFRPVLRDLLNGKPIPDKLATWWKRCCAHTICRLLWDLKEVDNSISNLLAPDSLTESQKPLRRSLLQSLKVLHDSATQPSRPDDLVHMNITCLISHHASLNNHREIMEMVIHVFQNLANSNEMELDMVKARLQMVFASDAIHARRLAYHAASIIAISRECTVYTPCETFRVFDAYAYILAFVKFGPKMRKNLTSSDRGGDAYPVKTPIMKPHPHNESQSGDGSVRLDRLPWSRNASENGVVELWINKGQVRASLDGADDVEDERNYTRIKCSALKTIEKLNLWGLSLKFYKTLESFT